MSEKLQMYTKEEMGEQIWENTLVGKVSIGGNVGCRQQQQPDSCPRCECPHAGGFAGKTSLPSVRAQMHMGTVAAVSPVKVPEVTTV